MFVSYDIIFWPRFFNPSKPRNRKLNSIKKSKRRDLILPRRKKTGPVDIVIHKITYEDGMLEDITIESSRTVERVGSGDIGATVVEMDTSGHKTKRNHVCGPSYHVHLDHNSSPYAFFKLMMIEEFRSVILQECTNMIAAM